MLDINSTISLNDGQKIPILGLGVFQSAENTQQAVEYALKAGYRHIDTAAIYGNEHQVAQAIKASGVKRSEIYITTKLWNADMRNGTEKEAIEKSLKLLNTDYIDLYLLHWPVAGKFSESWAILEEYNRNGILHSIGVSNFHVYHLDELLLTAKTVPAVNQIECHPLLTQESLSEYCRKNGIRVEAWAPLGRGNVLNNKTIIEIAHKYDKTPAQIIIRWHIQNDRIVIPKSVHEDRIISNTKVFDFKLENEDMKAISSLNENKRFGSDPDNFDF